MSRFASIEIAPPDPILGLNELFKADQRSGKVNLGVGVFVNSEGKTPTFQCITEAGRRIVAENGTKTYLPITGLPKYTSAAKGLIFGTDLPEHLISAQTPGGTGALRVAGDFIFKNLPNAKVWVSNPSWANHKGIFAAAGLDVQSYAYFDPTQNGIDREAFFAAISEIPATDVVVFHACCHNPTGADLSADDWKKVATIAQEKGWTPLIDCAYQGFGEGLDTDAQGVRTMAASGVPFFLAQSFSKNFGLYQDRVGAIHIACTNSEEATRVASRLKTSIRVNYSNPPAHGAHLVAAVLGDAGLTSQWEEELDTMRIRINGVRTQFVAKMAAAGVSRDFSFLEQQRGMFSFTGLNREQAIKMREDFGVYMVESGRINVAGLTDKNIDYVVDAIKQTLN
tara:strand:+ start:2335 stop:3522 length:1188 start_codon:yes stop_codon:yes gene_type:complete